VSERETRSLALLMALAAAGCAAQTYDGPRRSSAEIAVVETDGTVIMAVDQIPVHFDKVEVLPGLRALLVRLSDDHPITASNDWTVRTSQEAISVCFVARPGHTYTARPVYAHKAWRAEIIDQNTAERVRTDGFSAENEDCAESEGTFRQAHRVPVPAPIPIYIPQ
jgi:hypothetical protein